MQITKSKVKTLKESSIVVGLMGAGIIMGVFAAKNNNPGLLNVTLGIAGLCIFYMIGVFAVTAAKIFDKLDQAKSEP